ncbi:MAG: lipopolysaccharide biosynthesis protein [Spirochaetia bacterium]|nr:lipopolysaccharide biosynthesis protein [Spirochaetia bacterium]
MEKIEEKSITGFIWRLSERVGAQLVTFIVSIVLARILVPEDYGAIAILMIFINVADLFVVSGLGNALIQKKDSDNVDYSSVFYLNIIISLILYSIIYYFAPSIAEYFDKEILKTTLRVLSLKVPLAAINSVQQAYVSKHMMFRKFFFATIIGTIVSAFVGIILAYLGFGIWALVWQYMTNSVMDTIILWFTVKWRPDLVFSFKRVKQLFSYGWKIFASAFLIQACDQLKSLFIGKFYSSSDLAFYQKGNQFPSLIVVNINSSFSSVLFPSLALMQDERERFNEFLLKSIRMSTYIVFPLMAGLYIVADNLIPLMLTDKWNFSIPYLRIAAVYLAFQPFTTAFIDALNAIGKSDVTFKQSIIKRLIGLVLIIITINISVFALAISDICITLLAIILNAIAAKKYLNLTVKEQFLTIIPNICITFIMVVVVYLIKIIIGKIILSNILMILIQVFIGISFYILLSFVCKINEFYIILRKLKNIFLKIKRGDLNG